MGISRRATAEAREGNALMTPEDAAKLLRVAPRTVKKWLRNGTLPGHKVGNRITGAWRLDEQEVRAVVKGIAGVKRGMLDWETIAGGAAKPEHVRDELARRLASLVKVLPSQEPLRNLLDRFTPKPGQQLRDIPDEALASFRGALVRFGAKVRT